jgi:hypothetical protein
MAKKKKPVAKPEKKKSVAKEKNNNVASFDKIVGALLKVPHKNN